MSKRKKKEPEASDDAAVTQASPSPSSGALVEHAVHVEEQDAEEHVEEAPFTAPAAVSSARGFDAETTVNLSGDKLMPGRDDLDEVTVEAGGDSTEQVDTLVAQRRHLRGLLEALVFAADSPITPKDLAKLAHASLKQVKDLLEELKHDYQARGMHLDEVNGGFCFRTSPKYAPFVRDLTKQKPVRLTRAQVETLAIIAYRQPITRPEIDEVRGVDSGPVLKLLLERDLVRILGKRDEPGRPLIYGTTGNFLEFFGLKSLKDLPTLREFTELSDESRDAFEEELGESPPTEDSTDDEDAAPVADIEEPVIASADESNEALAELERLQAEEHDHEEDDGDPDALEPAAHDDLDDES